MYGSYIKFILKYIYYCTKVQTHLSKNFVRLFKKKILKTQNKHNKTKF